MEYRVKRSADYDYLAHGGKKGMKWGYNDGKKNGKRTASDIIKDKLGFDERADRDAAVSAQQNAVRIENKMKKELSEYKTFAKKANINEQDALEASKTDYNDAIAERKAADAKAAKAVSAYYKTPLGKLERATSAIKSGASRVEKLLRKRLGR